MMFKISVLTIVLLNILPTEGKNACDTYGKILKAGYPAEKYDLVTEDGYILEVSRIPHGKNQTSMAGRPVVFMMHGLLASATSFIALGPKYAMAFNLADSGFDVWLGNARGVCNSRRHKTLDPDDRKDKVAFFDFTWDNIGLYDLPVMIDFALRKSGQAKLHYIGHSQGATAFLVLNSMKPQYNTKFISAHLLAGVGYKNNFPNIFLRGICTFTNPLWNVAKTIGLVEFQSDWIFTNFNRNATKDEVEDIMEEKISMNEVTTSASLKQLAHFGQNIKDKQFRRWDYTPLYNLMVYGSWTPPKYDLSKINVDIVMHYTVADILLDERDVLAMVKDLPKARSRRIAKETFAHTDFVRSTYVKTLVTDYIIDKLRSY